MLKLPYGKSLFVSMLHHYYAWEFQPQFNDLFGKLAVGKNLTPWANQYLVLNFFAKSVTENGFVRKFYETIK